MTSRAYRVDDRVLHKREHGSEGPGQEKGQLSLKKKFKGVPKDTSPSFSRLNVERTGTNNARDAKETL